MTGRDGIAPGDIIRIVPAHRWAGCLAEVTEPKAFGCVAVVLIPHNDGTPPGEAYIRLDFTEYEVVARAKPEEPR